MRKAKVLSTGKIVNVRRSSDSDFEWWDEENKKYWNHEIEFIEDEEDTPEQEGDVVFKGKIVRVPIVPGQVASGYVNGIQFDNLTDFLSYLKRIGDSTRVDIIVKKSIENE